MNDSSKKNKDLSECCPYCASIDYSLWAFELGFSVVRCDRCSLLFVSPRPSKENIDESVRTGYYTQLGLDVRSRRIPIKIARYKRIFNRMFSDLWSLGKPITWVDVGCGYGEVLEAVHKLAPAGSKIAGYEPMYAKAEKAMALGLDVTLGYLSVGVTHADVISVVDVFSHIPDFHDFLAVIASNLSKNGLFYLETGNLADLKDRHDFPDELGVPDHLVFAGEKHLVGYLDQAGFDIEKIEYIRTDKIIEFAKGIVKRLLGRPFIISIPYSSKYRQILVRARLR